MKTIYSIHNSCLYPHPLLTTVNPHAHEDTHSRAGVEGYSIFGILVSEGHDYPLPPVWAYRRGHTPYLIDFVVVALLKTFFKLFLWVHFLVRVWFPYYCVCVLWGTWANIPPLLFPIVFLFAFVLV